MPAHDFTTRPFLHPLHAILLAFPIALFTGTVASDLTYLNSTEIQWTNFSAWLNAFGMVFAGLVLLWAAIATLRARKRGRIGRPLAYLLLLAATFVVGLVNAFHHSQDAWSSVGTSGLVLSIVTALLALAAGWVAYSGTRIAR